MKIARGQREDGVVIGNSYDKYGSRNFIAQRLQRGFERALLELVDRSGAARCHEVGCGEGFWTIALARRGLATRGTDFSERVIALARENAQRAGISVPFAARSIYELNPPGDRENLILCCEVLEHLERPADAMEILSQLAAPHLIVSVPREPLWRLLNCARGKYLTCLGNTPGHLQHWSKTSFLRFVERWFVIEAVRTPLPWTMALCRAR